MKRARTKSKLIKVVCNIRSDNMLQFMNLQKVLWIGSDCKDRLNEWKTDFDSQITALKTHFLSHKLSFEDIVQAVVDRQKRKNNIVIIGMPEHESNLPGNYR